MGQPGENLSSQEDFQIIRFRLYCTCQRFYIISNKLLALIENKAPILQRLYNWTLTTVLKILNGKSFVIALTFCLYSSNYSTVAIQNVLDAICIDCTFRSGGTGRVNKLFSCNLDFLNTICFLERCMSEV